MCIEGSGGGVEIMGVVESRNEGKERGLREEGLDEERMGKNRNKKRFPVLIKKRHEGRE